MEYQTFHNEAGTEVRAARVDKDNAGQKVQLVGGRPYTTKDGDVVVETQNANYVDVVSARDFDKDYSEGEHKASKSTSDSEGEHKASKSTSDSETTDGLFDPNARSAADVREYLSRTDIDESERERVRAAEEQGRNRKTALNSYPE